MADPHIAELIADRMANGLIHPGDPANGQASMEIKLPLFRMPGQPEEMYKNIQITVRLIAESIVYLIETEGNSDIIPRTQEVNGAPQSDVEDMGRRVDDLFIDPKDFTE